MLANRWESVRTVIAILQTVLLYAAAINAVRQVVLVAVAIPGIDDLQVVNGVTVFLNCSLRLAATSLYPKHVVCVPFMRQTDQALLDLFV